MRPDESIASEVTHQVRAIVSAAEDVADSLKREAERRAELRLREADAEVARRLSGARAEADRIVSHRSRRIADLSDAIADRADSVLARLDEASVVRSELEAVLAALAEAAGQVRRETLYERPGSGAEGPSSPPRREPPSPPAEHHRSDEPTAGHDAPTHPAGDSSDELPSDGRTEAVERNGGGSAENRVLAHASAAARAPGGQQDRFGGARQVAFQMAVAGSTRAEVAAHLQRTFELSDPHPVLNAVFGEADIRG